MAVTLWEDGHDTATIARIINSERELLVPESDVANAPAHYRDEQAGARVQRAA